DQDLAEQHRAERRRRSRLHDDWVPGAQRRRDFVAHEVEREIERRDAEDGTEGGPPRDAEATTLTRVQPDELAGESLRFLAGESHRVDRAIDLGRGVLPRLAALADDRRDELLAPGFDAGRGVEQDARALPGVLLARALEGRSGCGERLIEVRPRAHRDFVEHLTREGVGDGERGRAL